MPITVKEKVRLRGEAMKLKPVLKIGRGGFSDGVREQLDALLTRHRLVKARLELDDRKARAALAEEIAASLEVELIGATGKAAVFYRPPVEDDEADDGE